MLYSVHMQSNRGWKDASIEDLLRGIHKMFLPVMRICTGSDWTTTKNTTVATITTTTTVQHFCSSSLLVWSDSRISCWVSKGNCRSTFLQSRCLSCHPTNSTKATFSKVTPKLCRSIEENSLELSWQNLYRPDALDELVCLQQVWICGRRSDCVKGARPRLVH